MISVTVVIGHGSLPVIRSRIGGDLHRKARSRCLYAVFAAGCESSPGYLIELSIGTSQYSLDWCARGLAGAGFAKAIWDRNAVICAFATRSCARNWSSKLRVRVAVVFPARFGVGTPVILIPSVLGAPAVGAGAGAPGGVRAGRIGVCGATVEFVSVDMIL